MFSENQLITRFILGSHADIKPVILSNKSLWGRVSFDEFVRRARLWVIHTVCLSGKGPEQVMPWLFCLKGRQHSHNLTKLRTKGRSLANKFWPLGKCPFATAAPTLLLWPLGTTKYSFPVATRRSWSAATRPKRGSAKLPRAEALGRPSVVGAQRPSATRPPRPGWVNPSTPQR